MTTRRCKIIAGCC